MAIPFCNGTPLRSIFISSSWANPAKNCFFFFLKNPPPPEISPLPLPDPLPISPQLKLLVTSRQVLHVHAEHEYAVPPLAMPDLTHLPDPATLAHYPAVTLFLQRAQLVKPEFVLDRKSTRLNSSHSQISYAVFCL